MASDTDPAAVLQSAIRLALSELHPGPPLGAFGIARDDCALAHMDYFTGIHMAAAALVNALSEVTGRSAPDISREYVPAGHPCDGECCTTPEKAAAARQRYRDAHTYVKEWVPRDDA